MMTFFPIPYKDELLYSVLARYHVRSGNVSIKATQKDIYGTDSITAIMDLPSHIYRIMENLPVGHQYTPEYLITKHTLYPFYAAFLPSEHAINIKESMIGDKGGSIYNKIGLMASSVKLNKYFKFCPQCVEDDMKNLGELYWHRIHQIPGVLVCPDHKMPLYDSQVPVRGYNKHDYRLATPENCKISTEIYYSDVIMEKAINLADDVVFLLNKIMENKPLGWFKEQYINRIKQLGIANVNGRIKQKEMLISFIDFYDHDFLRMVQSDINFNSISNWLNDLLRRNNRTSPPIKHLLFIRFLRISPSHIFSKKIEYKPFGEKPWPCLNPVANHYLNPVICDIALKYGSDSKRPIGIFKCNICGFVYLRTGPDLEDKDRYKITKIKHYGPVWEAKLIQLSKHRLSLRETARQLEVDPATVKKYTRKLGIEAYWLKRSDEEDKRVVTVAQGSSEEKKDRYRSEWLNLRRQYPNSRKTELRQLNNKVYTWLYRNDKDWLTSNSPMLKSPVNENHRVNWENRDRDIYEKVRITVDDMISLKGKPIRITISSVGSRLGIRPLLEKHLNKLPMTKGYLNDKIESIKDFQIRRIQWSVQELLKEGQELSLWRIFRKARIRENFQKDLQEETIKLIVENNSFPF